MGRNRKRAEEADSPRHLWRGVRGEIGITGGQSVAPEKLELARKLRGDMTPQERLLWESLRRNQVNGLHFRRQQVIAGFIVDFYCAAAGLTVEVDGAYHLETEKYDAERDRALAEMGIRTLRISNQAVTADLPGVLGAISEEAERRRFPRHLWRGVRGET